MNTKLRLRQAPSNHREPPTLRFPVEAAKDMPTGRRWARQPGLGETVGAPELVRGIEHTLDFMQAKLNDIKAQLSPGYRLPRATQQGGSDRPFAA